MGTPFDDTFQLRIKKALENEFPRLEKNGIDLLTNYTNKITQAIFRETSLDDYESLVHQLFQNNGRDIRGLALLLLPTLKEGTNKKLESLDDIYTKKHKVGKQMVYTYSDVQYQRSIRSAHGVTSERKYTKHILDQNYFLLSQTIAKVFRHMYVNWIDILPVGLDEYKKTKLYNNTKITVQGLIVEEGKTVSNGKILPPIISGPDEKYDPRLKSIGSGLHADEIYETVVNHLYHNMKRYKWMIYDVRNELNDMILPMVYVISQLLPIDNIIKNKRWLHISPGERTKFGGSWTQMRNSGLSDSQVDGYSGKTLQKILKAIVIFFDNYNPKKNIILEEGIYKELHITSIQEMMNGENNNMDDLLDTQMNQMEETLRSLEPKYIYEFLCYEIQSFKKTWYGSQLFVGDEIIDLIAIPANPSAEGLPNIIKKMFAPHDPKKEFLDLLPPTLKNIFNFSKSLGSATKNKEMFMELGRHWSGLDYDTQKMIMERLNNPKAIDNSVVDSKTGRRFMADKKEVKQILEWFNISGYYKRLHGSDYPQILKTGITQMENRIVQTYFHIMMMLTDIIFEVQILNGSLTTFKPTKEISDKLFYPKDITLYQKTFLDRLSAINLSPDKIENWKRSYYYLTNEPYDEIFMNNLRTNGIWCSYYAMDWVSQIAFFHKFINNRVMFITGSTGVGKSTQVPKLALYAQKLLTYNMTPKVISTQPRIPPTIGNAKTISIQLSQPIKLDRESDIPTNNFYVQYKHQFEEHTDVSIIPTIKVMTDGTLLSELSTNPLLKRKIKTESPSYTNNNVFDVILVDEAHEHNANMDMILTLMKYALYYNNGIKLLIISATMEEDEKMFRVFYRDVNPNLGYPLDRLEEIGITKSGEYDFSKSMTFDRYNVDQRLHVSPPGFTTNYEIKDYYQPTVDPINLVFSLMQKGYGDLLFFEPGVYEISETVRKLNRILPAQVIALPYHSKMSATYKNNIENINTLISGVSIHKNAVTGDNEHLDLFAGHVPTGIYKQTVIVATNIAEGSITLPSLRYVVDTGKHKISKYNYTLHGSILSLSDITETSRIQRKGRVGRVASGEIYYMYPEGSLLSNKSVYNFSIQEIHNNLYDLLATKQSEKPMIINDIYKKLERWKTKMAMTTEWKEKMNEELDAMPFGLGSIFKQQYYDAYADEYIINFGNDNDHNIAKIPKPFLETGYSKETLDDETGEFYIVHPDETEIERPLEWTLHKKFKSEKIQTIWKYLQDIDLIDNKYDKTTKGLIISDLLKRLLLSSPSLALTVAYAKRYSGLDIDVLHIIAMLLSSNITMSPWYGRSFKNGKSKAMFQDFKRLYGTSYGDLGALWEIKEKFRSAFPKLDLSGEIQTSFDTFKMLKNKYLSWLKNQKINITEKNLSMFRRMDLYGELDYFTQLTIDEYKFIKQRMKGTDNYFSTLIEPYEKAIINWCDEMKINHHTLLEYLKKFHGFSNIYENFLLEKDKEMSIILRKEPEHDLVHAESQKDIVLSLFSLTHKHTVVLPNFKGGFYHKRIQDQIIELRPLGKRIPVLETVLNTYGGQPLFYLKEDEDTSTIAIVQPVLV
jgi:HrpA-like RNA helicase